MTKKPEAIPVLPYFLLPAFLTFRIAKYFLEQWTGSGSDVFPDFQFLFGDLYKQPVNRFLSHISCKIGIDFF